MPSPSRQISFLFTSVAALLLLEQQVSSFLHYATFISSPTKRPHYYVSTTPIKNIQLERNNKKWRTLNLSNKNELETTGKSSGSNSKSTTIRFSGCQIISSAPIALPKNNNNDNNKHIISFFKEHRDLLLSKEENIQVIVSPSESDLNNWKIKNNDIQQFQSSNDNIYER